MLISILLAAAAVPCVAGDSPSELRRIDSGEPACDKTRDAVRAASASEQSAVKAFFDQELYDGGSARWKFAGVKDGKICGQVNAKNRMGGYVGWTPFIFSVGSNSGTILDDGNPMWGVWRKVCGTVV